MASMAAAERRWKLGYNTLTWAETRDPDLERVFATIREAGWEGIELLDNDANWSGPPSRVRAMLERVGLRAIAMLGGVQIDDARGARQLELQRRMIEYGAELGCEAYVFIGGDRVLRRQTTDEDIRRLRDVADALVEHAEAYGMTANHHSHPRCTVEREEEQDRLLAIADPRLRVCLDVGISLFMDEDYLGQIQRYAGRTGYVHLKDWGHGKYCILGQGTRGVDWGEVLGALTATGYEGWVTTELSWYAETDADASCLANRDYLRALGY
jgi:sugar phosphate isomerase/epimerase